MAGLTGSEEVFNSAYTASEREASIGNAKTKAAMLTAIGVSQSQVDGLAGAISASATNVLATIEDVPDAIEFGSTGGTATEGNDPRIPTQDENNALAGTYGVPSASNPYVTTGDNRLVSGVTTAVYLDCNRTDTYTADGTPDRPFKTVSDSLAYLSTQGMAGVGYYATGTYDTGGGTFTLPDLPILIHGNLSTISGSSTFNIPGTYTSKNLNVVGNVNFTAGSGPHDATLEGQTITGSVGTASGVTLFLDRVTITGNFSKPAGSITYKSYDTVIEGNITGTGTIYTMTPASGTALTAGNVVITDENGALVSSTITAAALEYLEGLTGNVQDQLDGKLTAANNLSDLTDSVTALANLGMNYICWPQEMPDSGRFATLTDQKQISLPSASYTASTLSIVGATATITDSAGGIPTASFPVNMTMVTMSGWTNAANNAVQLRVSSVSATTLVLEGDGAETLVDESAGASITLRGVTLSNTSGFFKPAGAVLKAAGVALYDNSTRGGTGGALSPNMLSLLLAMDPTASWRYMVEFGMIKITSASATNPNPMFVNEGKAYFANFSNIGCMGHWCRVVGGLGPFVAGYVSVDGSAYTYYSTAYGGYALPDNNWHYIKAFRTAEDGYKPAHAGIIYSTAAGQEVEIACPFFTGCVPLSSLKWTSVLAKK